jgi:predicted permease
VRSVRRFFVQFASLFDRRRAEREFDAELVAHLALLQEEFERRGMTPQQARGEARLKLGGIEQAKQLHREARTLHWLETLAQDMRFALRMMRKNPGFTTVAVLTLALGIGANTAIFSVIDGILWQPSPYAETQQIVTISSTKISGGAELYAPLPPADVQTLASETPSLREVAMYTFASSTLTSEQAPELVQHAQVSGGFFTMLGGKPILGRPIVSSDAQQGQDGVAVLNYSLWRGHYSGDPRIAGHAITLDDHRYTIVGVMPKRFDFGLNASGSGAGVWTPLVIAPADEHNQGAGIHVVARLKDGVSVAAANAQLKTIAPRIWPDLPPIMRGCDIKASDIMPSLGFLKTSLFVLIGAVAFVLLIACINVSALFLARGVSRQREIAMRKALGAPKTRIVSQFLVEGLLVSLGAGCLAVLLASGGVWLLRTLAPPSEQQLAQARLDVHVLCYILAASLVACLLSALLPAIQASSTSVGEAIKGNLGQSSSSAARPNRLRNVLVVLEIASALVLVIGAALMSQTLANLLRRNLGFRTDHILTASIRLSPSICDLSKKTDSSRCKAADSEILRAISASPDVEVAAAASASPLSAGYAYSMQIDGQKSVYGFSTNAFIADRNVAPGYFRALGIALLSGRDFNDADAGPSPSVAIVNRTFADRYLKPGAALGAHFVVNAVLGPKAEQHLQIVGVVADSQDEGHSISMHDSDPEYYIPLAQNDWPVSPDLIVRTASDPTAILPAIRQKLASVDKEAALTNIQTMDQKVAGLTAQPKFETTLLVFFAILGMALAIIGVYGVVAYRVAQRTREIGIRMALGAQQSSVLGLVLREAALLATAGILVGIGGAFALTRFLRAFLFEIKPTDPATFAAVAVALFLVALLAGYIPARRAMRVDPMVALRHE